MAGGRTSAQQIRLAERRSKAVALRKTGATMRAIAAKIREEFALEKYTQTNAFRDIDASLREVNNQLSHDTEELRALELARYDDWLFKLFPKIAQGNEVAIKTAIQISVQRCKLLGLEAPIQVKVEEIVNTELTTFLEALRPLLPKDVYRTVLTAVSTLSDRAATAPNN